MIRTTMAATITGLVLAACASAQTAAPRLHWQQGQVLTYRVEQQMQVGETVGTMTTQSKQQITLVKRWQVTAVDPAGVATLQLSLTSMRLETTPASGDPLLYDSSAPEKSNPQMKETLGRYIGVPLAVVRLDPLGRVVEVKESKFGPASRFESEPPFVCPLPEAAPQNGQTWERNFTIVLEPPQGTGERHAAIQKCQCKAVAGGKLQVLVASELKAPPRTVADQIPLLQSLPQGEVLFDLQTGRMESCRLTIDREVKEHQGPGSSYRYSKSYSEQLIQGQ